MTSIFGHNEEAAISSFIEKRRAIWAARVPFAVKVIALAILEHMNPDCLECWPSKDRLAFMCNMSRSTFDRHYSSAKDLFNYQNRRGKTTVFSPKILDVAKELAALWPGPNDPVVDGKIRYKPSPKMRGGQNEPPFKMSDPQKRETLPQNEGTNRSVRIDKVTDPDGSVPDGEIEFDARDQLWNRAVPWLVKASGLPASKIKPIVGKWCKTLTYDELLHAMRSAQKARTGDPIAYIGKFIASAKQAETTVRREKGRLVVMNGFKSELETILEGRNLQRTLDQIGARIPIGISGIELETKVRGMAIELVEKVADQDRRYANAAKEKSGGLDLL